MPVPFGARSRRHSAVGLVLICALLLARDVSASPMDSTFTRWEVGGAADVTNELFYQDTYSDTSFLGRRLSSTPEVLAGAALSLDHQRATPGSQWWLRTHLDSRFGDKLQRLDGSAQMRTSQDRAWRAALEPTLA
ncbi:MAG: hypothetical protein ABIU54_13960, partial [Candidatus Eisenbacteria bacterium]